MYKEYFNKTNSFDENGEFTPYGWSKMPVFDYNKLNTTASEIRIKESDTYFIKNSQLFLMITIANFGMYGLISGVLIDFNYYKISTSCTKKLFPFIKFKMPQNSTFGDVSYNDKKVGMKFSVSYNKRFLRCDFLDFYDNKNLYFNIELDENHCESLNVAFPNNSGNSSFFIKRFIPQMNAKGIVRFGGNEYDLTKEKTSAFFNWSRISLASKTNYHELISSGLYKNREITIYLAGGTFQTAEGIENCIFIDKKLLKLGIVKIRGKEHDSTAIWKFQDIDKKILLKFEPSTKGGNYMNTKCDKKIIIYGNLYGRIIDNDGKIIHIDGFDTVFIKSIL